MLKKIMLVGNHSCSNRGDAAITRGLIELLEKECGQSQLTIYSRYPKGASEILAQPVFDDVTKYSPSLLGKVLNRLLRGLNVDVVALLMVAVYYLPLLNFLLPHNIKQMIERMAQHDLVVQVGGSFLVDLYGMHQYRLILSALISNTPIVLIGHSLGPYGTGMYRLLAKWCLIRVAKIVVRDQDTIKLTHLLSSTIKCIVGADTAWLVSPTINLNSTNTNLNSTNSHNQEKIIAITSRRLSPFDRRLGLSQEVYEQQLASLCECLVQRHYQVHFYSTCTSFDGYHNDDRVVAASIVSKVAPNYAQHVSVVNTELTDVELGEALSRCHVTIGTRLHSAIISMNFGTPAIALAYEHKTTGLYQDMGLGEYAIQLDGEFSAALVLDRLVQLESDWDSELGRYQRAVQQQRALAKSAALSSIEQVNE
jgi:colanic acid/amylovoran biosynthesis protein